MMADILKSTETALDDKSIEEYEYNVFDPITVINLNNGVDIRISTESQDMLTHPSESDLIFDGRRTKASATAYANADEVALTNKAIMHLLAELNITYPNC